MRGIGSTLPARNKPPKGMDAEFVAVALQRLEFIGELQPFCDNEIAFFLDLTIAAVKSHFGPRRRSGNGLRAFAADFELQTVDAQ